MKIGGGPLAAVDWRTVSPTEHPGEVCKALWQTVEAGNIEGPGLLQEVGGSKRLGRTSSNSARILSAIS